MSEKKSVIIKEKITSTRKSKKTRTQVLALGRKDTSVK